MNALFVTYKPPFVSSNAHLSFLKRKYNNKKAGFSGTLDPFAKGVLVIAFGKYTRLFRFLKKTPKKYVATLWLGAKSESLDIEKIECIKSVEKIDLAKIQKEIENLKGEISYTPPKFCAKKVDGKRAYELARESVDFKLKSSKMSIYDMRIINYSHPFLTFEAEVSEGAYIRSLGDILANRFGVFGALCNLERIEEGKFVYNGEKFLNPLEYLDIEENFYLGSSQDLYLGRKLSVDLLKTRDNGIFYLKFENFFSIIEVDKEVKYLVNRIDLC